MVLSPAKENNISLEDGLSRLGTASDIPVNGNDDETPVPSDENDSIQITEMFNSPALEHEAIIQAQPEDDVSCLPKARSP